MPPATRQQVIKLKEKTLKFKYYNIQVYQNIKKLNSLTQEGKLEAGVAWGNATETSNGDKLKYEVLALPSASSAKH